MEQNEKTMKNKNTLYDLIKDGGGIINKNVGLAMEFIPCGCSNKGCKNYHVEISRLDNPKEKELIMWIDDDFDYMYFNHKFKQLFNTDCEVIDCIKHTHTCENCLVEQEN